MTHPKSSPLLVVAALAAFLATGCGDDDPTGSAGAIQISLEPAALSVVSGETGRVTASLTRTGGFAGPVTLAVTGLPAGITAVVTPTVLTGTTATAAVDLSVAAGVAPGQHAVTITATAQGIDEASASVQLAVTEPGDFALTVNPSALTIVAGGNGSTEVTIARTNFTGEVTLALASPPAGISAAFDPGSTTATVATLVLHVASDVAPGAYALMVTASAALPGVRSAPLALTVPAPPAAGEVRYLFCGPSSAPVFFAHQDGTGPWVSVSGVTSGGATSFTFNQAEGYGGVLMVHQLPDPAIARTPLRQLSASRVAGRVNAFVTEVRYASTAELAQDGLESCASSQPTRTVTGNIIGVADGSYATVSLGGVVTIFDGGQSSNPTLFAGVPAGPVDLVGSLTTPGSAPSRMLVRRNVQIPSGGSLAAPIDFTGAGSLVPASAQATITGADGEDLEIFTDLVTVNGRGAYWSDLSPGPQSTRPWAGLPAAAMTAGDFHGLAVFATPDDDSGDFRVALKYVGPVTDQTLALGPALDPPVATEVAAGAYPRFRFQGNLKPEYDKGAEISFFGPDGFDSGGNGYSLIATSSWLAARGNGLAYDLTMPDVADLPGFPLASRLSPGANTVATGGFGFPGAGIFDLRPALGGEFKAAARNTTVDVP